MALYASLTGCTGPTTPAVEACPPTPPPPGEVRARKLEAGIDTLQVRGELAPFPLIADILEISDPGNTVRYQ